MELFTRVLDKREVIGNNQVEESQTEPGVSLGCACW